MAGEIDKTTLDKVGCMSISKKVNGSSSSLELSSGLETVSSLAFPCDSVREVCNDGDWDTELKSKKVPASMGTVSSVIGKDYAKPRPNLKNNFEARKPLKLDSEDFPVSEIWAEQMMESRTPSIAIDNEVEEFLFQILGTGFQLEKTVILEVLGKCGYDMQKSTEKLLDLSSSVLEKHDDLVGLDSTEFTEKRITDVHEEKRIPCSAQRKPAGKPKRDDNLQRDILQSLFSVPERSEQDPKINRKVREPRRQRTMHRLVAEPPEISSTGSYKTSATNKQIAENGVQEDADDSYNVLRQGVREHWATAKEYYRAAVEAFIKGQKERATRLAKQAQFFSDKAREADEKSSQKLIDTSKANDADDEIFLDLFGFEPRTAVSSVKDHLKFVSGNSAIKYLRVAIGMDDPKGARKRLVVKKLANASVKWTEEKNGEILLIRVDTINPKSLSFVKKKAYLVS